MNSAKNPPPHMSTDTSSKIVKVGIVGYLGKMGQALLQEIESSSYLEFTAGLKRGDNLAAFFLDIDIVIDFSSPRGLFNCLEYCYHHKPLPIISGTTGHNIDLAYYSGKLPILWSANMSLGINFLLEFFKTIPQNLNFRAGINEIHHEAKIDSPSGTALKIAEVLREACPPAQIACLRIGNNIGEHTITLEGELESITITHRAKNRSLFASSALQLALWLKNQPPGLYSVADTF